MTRLDEIREALKTPATDPLSPADVAFLLSRLEAAEADARQYREALEEVATAFYLRNERWSEYETHKGTQVGALIRVAHVLGAGVMAGGEQEKDLGRATLAALAPSVQKRYRTIVVDPPWPYEDGFPQGLARGVSRSTVPLPYAPMSIAEIRRLPVYALSERSAWLFLWTTNRYLPHAFPLIGAWGFEYRQTVTWRKTGCPSPFVTSLAPSHSEYLLIARAGGAERIGRFPSSVIDAPAQSRHSAKPELFLDLIEQATPGPRVELFARRNRFGWDTWGEEALEHVSLTPGVGLSESVAHPASESSGASA